MRQSTILVNPAFERGTSGLPPEPPERSDPLRAAFGPFLTSTLVFDSKNDKVSLTNTKVVFNFVGGANPTKFALTDDFDLEMFFRLADGTVLPALDQSLAGDTFVEDVGGVETTLALDANGSLAPVSAVPEPSSLLSFGAGLGGTGLMRRRKPALAAKRMVRGGESGLS